MAMPRLDSLSPCLWFDGAAEDAARFYTGIFPNSRITHVARYGEAGREIHGGEPGSVMTVAFELDGTPFTALNGGPLFHFSEAISFQINCESQADIDYFWTRLSEGGDPKSQQCGWLKDKFGLSWQVVPTLLPELLMDRDPKKRERAMQAMLQMKKLDIAALERAVAA
jgi:predicted 3-demethylubiquinone-9 3-methyltransferase (glyoxalase superfamily)